MLLTRKYTLHQNVIRGEEAETHSEDVENQTVIPGEEAETQRQDIEKEIVVVTR